METIKLLVLCRNLIAVNNLTSGEVLMKSYLFYALLLFIFSNCFSIDLESEISNYQLSDEIYISKARQMLADEIRDRNEDKVKDIVTHLLEKYEYSHSVPLYPWERFIIALEADSLELGLKTLEDIIKPKETYINYLYPKQDALSMESEKLLFHNYSIYVTQIITSNLNNEQKMLFQVFLEGISNGTVEKIDQKKVNEKCDTFLEKYPNSDYYDFVREQLRFVIVPGNWGYGFDFSMGTAIMTEDLKNYFQNGLGIDISFYATYDSFVFKAKLILASINAKIDFNENGSWEEGDHFNLPFYGLQLGYELFESKKFKFEPHLLCGVSEIDYTYKDDDKDILDPTFAYGLGFSIYYKFTDTIAVDYNRRYENGSWYVYLNCDYINSNFDKEYDNYKGGTLFLNLGIGGYVRPFVRDF